MNKFLTIGAVVVAISVAIYFEKKENSPVIPVQKYEQAATSLPTANAPASLTAGKMANTSVTQAQSSTSSDINKPLAAIEQTQNALDFNAPGAGTAQQKAGAAAAANKAYQESKQPVH
jgi:hypothetical protein